MLCHNGRRGSLTVEIDTGISEDYRPTPAHIEEVLLARKTMKVLRYV